MAAIIFFEGPEHIIYCKNKKSEKVRVLTFSSSKKARGEEEKSGFRKNESKIVNFVEIFYASLPCIHTNPNSLKIYV